MRLIGRPISVGLCAAAFLTAAIGCALAQDTDKQDADKGQTEYMENCAGCHGADARGAGPLSAKLKTKPADLTLLAKRNHGSFDTTAVYQMIDGRSARPTHRGAEMPIWGCRHDPPAVPAPPALSTHQRQNPKKSRVGDEKARDRARFASRSSLRLRGDSARPHPRDRRIFEPAAGEVIR